MLALSSHIGILFSTISQITLKNILTGSITCEQIDLEPEYKFIAQINKNVMTNLRISELFVDVGW